MIEIETKSGIAVITMMRGKANALDIEFCEALAGRFKALRKSDAKAVVITGQLVISVAIDRFGLLGIAKQHIGAPRIVGLVLLVVGVVLVVRK